jgi:hypothetical protein
MFKKMLSYGTVAGLIVGIELSVVTITMNGHIQGAWGYALGYVTMLVALSAIFIAIKRQRDLELGGVIKFWPAFGLGLGISIFAGTYAKSMIQQQVAHGVSGEALAKFTAEMEQFKVQYANPLYRLPMTFAEIFPVGLLVSLVSAGLLRNSRFLPLRR